VRVAQREDDVLALDLRLVPDPLDLEFLREAVGHALDGVRDEAADEPVQGAVLLLVGGALDLDVPSSTRP
jgi:hypothetical protein